MKKFLYFCIGLPLCLTLCLLAGCGALRNAEVVSAVVGEDSELSGESAQESSLAEMDVTDEPEEESESESEPAEIVVTDEPEEESEPEPERAETCTFTTYTDEDGYTLSNDPSDFVLLSEAVPDVILEIRYYSTYNFVGQRVDGYEQPTALLTKEAAKALKGVSDDLMEQGYRLKIFDAYRPQAAVSHFVRWAEDLDDTKMKPYFYPELDKSVLFEQGYIAAHSGHSRGSTVDLTLFDMSTEREADMGGTFDYFGALSHPDYAGVTEGQRERRMLLRDAMARHGFKPISTEWWHFTLEDEPYPDTYFTFPVSEESVKE